MYLLIEMLHQMLMWCLCLCARMWKTNSMKRPGDILRSNGIAWNPYDSLKCYHIRDCTKSNRIIIIIVLLLLLFNVGSTKRQAPSSSSSSSSLIVRCGDYMLLVGCVYTRNRRWRREKRKKTNEIISTYTSLPCVSSFRNHALDVVVLFLVRYSTRSYMPL